MLDLTPLSMGIEIAGGYLDRLIEINTPLPADNSKIFTTTADNQETVRIKVYQGEAKIAENNELLGQFTFSGFRKAPRGEVQIEVNFEIDTNGILNVSAKDLETEMSQSVQMTASGRLEEGKVEELRQSSANVN